MSTPTLRPRCAIFALAAFTAESKIGGKLKSASIRSWRRRGVVGAATGVPGVRKEDSEEEDEEGGAERALAATRGREAEAEVQGVGVGVEEEEG